MKKPTIASLSKQVKEMEAIIHTQGVKLANQEVLLKNSEDAIGNHIKAIKSAGIKYSYLEEELRVVIQDRDNYQERTNNQADTIRQLNADVEGFKKRHISDMADVKNIRQETAIHLKVAQEFRSIIISALDSQTS